MYKYNSLRQLEADILDTKSQLYTAPVEGIEINSIRVIVSEDTFQQMQADIKERMNAIAQARGEEANPAINDATINQLKFADVSVFFERIKPEEEYTPYDDMGYQGGT